MIMPVQNMSDEIVNTVKKHERWRTRQCLNLIPSENVMSPEVRSLLSSELAHRYTARDKFYMGTRYLDALEQRGEKLAKAVFKAETADLRPLSGHVADLIVLATCAGSGKELVCVSPEDGGYPGMWKEGLAGHLGLKTTGFPFSGKDWNIRTDKAVQLIERVKPKLVIFGASLILFPQPVLEISKIAVENGAFVGFDGSHVLGLIAGGQFQDPLREGAHALFGSTHKSFFGPQGGIILADKEHGEYLKEKIYPAFVDNAHWNRIAALTLALAEMKRFGKSYATQVVRNAKALAKALYDEKLPVICEHLGFTSSHQVILDYGNYQAGRKNAEAFQQANIITDCVIRLGTCEVTRHGMKEKEMDKIAELLKRINVDNERPTTVRSDVARLVAEFPQVEYCFKE